MSEHEGDDPATPRQHRFPGHQVPPGTADEEPTTRFTTDAGRHDDPSVLGPFAFRSDQEPAATQSRRHDRPRTAGVLVAALLLGIAGGLAGAAGYDALDGGVADEPTSSAGASTDEQVSTPLRPSDRVTTDQDGRDRTPAPEGSPEAVAQQVLPSVVKINVAGNVAGGQGQGSGSGVILSEDGEILTNAHVVDVAEQGGEMTVDFQDGTSASAELVGTDPVTDLAVIRAQDVSGLTPADIGDSDALGVGEAVVAIGSPFGLTATVTSGIVSALDRPVSVGRSGTDPTTYPAIQTDAAINPGNSGGPLVNLAGQVVGINSSIRSSSGSLGGEAGSIGLGFAIPISKVLPIIDQLRNGETPTHARLGVTVMQPGSSGDPTRGGLVTGAGIADVEPGSSGDDAGLQTGDVVTRVDEQVITGVESLVATIRGYRPGDEVALTVLRDDETLELEATLDSDAEAQDS
jgi:putative serine protease PepD